MPEPPAGDVVVAHFDHQLGFQRRPLARPFRAPPAGTARRWSVRPRAREAPDLARLRRALGVSTCCFALLHSLAPSERECHPRRLRADRPSVPHGCGYGARGAHRARDRNRQPLLRLHRRRGRDAGVSATAVLVLAAGCGHEARPKRGAREVDRPGDQAASGAGRCDLSVLRLAGRVRAWCEANLPSWLGYGRAV